MAVCSEVVSAHRIKLACIGLTHAQVLSCGCQSRARPDRISLAARRRQSLDLVQPV